MVNQVQTILKRRNVLTTNKATMLAISGGQDSACLIAIAVQMRDQWKGPFGIISCNHLWQHDSFYGLGHVCRLGFLVDQPLYFVAAPFDIFNEANARSWRYNTIQRIGSLYDFSTICTGHTASDRVETILFNFVRGSGIRGLSSLGWNRWFISSYPNRYHFANFEGTASNQSSAFFDPKPPPFEPPPWSEAVWSLLHPNQPQPALSLLEKQQRFKWYLLLAQFFQEGQPILRLRYLK
ncbi:tRNA(Ile)-lysidine synthase, chloroplastic (chloroplast) [Coccomyxa sp. Obi]|nr:tRNA(Ile)-lysidine synthase, chloroplastic [Coccomyxa sp. Obi]